MSKESKGSGGFAAMRYNAKHPPHDLSDRALLAGKCILIVGATAGVGFDATVKFAQAGVARIVVGARDSVRAKAAIDKIQSAAMQAGAQCQMDLLEVDLAVPSSIRAFCDNVAKLPYAIDVAIVNAGVAVPSFQRLTTGWERTLQIEVLGKVGCAMGLAPLLRRERSMSRALLIITSSEGYLDVTSEQLRRDKSAEALTALDTYNRPENFDGERQYRIAKLLIQFAQQGLDSALTNTDQRTTGLRGPAVITWSPGMSRTSLGRDFGMGMKVMMYLMQLYVARTSEQGSRGLVTASTLDPDLANGKFWFNDTLDPRESVMEPRDWQSHQAKEWTRIQGVLEDQIPGITQF